MKSHDLPTQPDGIDDDSSDLPDPLKAADRVEKYISEFGDGLYDVTGGAPLYGRDLESLCRTVRVLEARNAELTADLMDTRTRMHDAETAASRLAAAEQVIDRYQAGEYRDAGGATEVLKELVRLLERNSRG